MSIGPKRDRRHSKRTIAKDFFTTPGGAEAGPRMTASLPRLLRWLLQNSYYEVLNQQHRFLDDLRATGGVCAATRRQTERDRLCDTFAARWRLRRRLGPRDVEWSITHVSAKKGLRLLTCPLRFMARDQRNPVTGDSVSAERQLALTEAYELPYRLRDPKHLERVGWRIYRWNVLKEGWGEIVEAEEADQPDRAPVMDDSHIRKSVHAFADLLDLPLRRGRRGPERGRQKKLGK